MRNIPYNGCLGPHQSTAVQWRRLSNVIANELSDCQQQTLIGYYLECKTISQIARERGVNKSTVSRTLRRAEQRLRLYLKY